MRWPASSPTWITAPSSPSRLPASSRWRAIRSAWPKSSRSTGSAATSSSTGSTSSAGPCRSPRARCSSGRRSPSRSARSARSSSPRCSSRKRGWPSRRASGSASTARATCGSRSSRTSSGSNRRSAGSSSSPVDRPFLPGGPTDMTEVRIGLLGLGTVGAGVAKILESRRAMLEERAGCRLTLAAVADVDLTRPREGLDIKKLPMTPDAARALADPSVQVIIELVGGLEPARSFILKALGAGKHVVTANKALLAHHRAELYDEARRRGVTLAFEAAVAGGIPLIQAIKEGLVANRILSVFGIVNGTSNYILSKMTDEALDFTGVLKEAQAAGYAEADPTLDIEGMDSAHKLQILVTLAFRTFIDLKDIHTEGITRVTQQDIAYARELGYRIKLLAIAKAAPHGVEARVHPTMIPAGSPLAAVAGVFNAIFITGDAVGDLMFYGRGAGQLPTASAIWADTLDIARRIAHGIPALALELPSAWRAGPNEGLARRHRAVPPLPSRDCQDAGRHALRGQHTAHLGAAPRRGDRLPPRDLPQVRGVQPDRLVQGSRDDDGDLESARVGLAGRDLRLDGQHLGLRGGVRGARRHPRLRHGAQRVGRPRQALAGRA